MQPFDILLKKIDAFIRRYYLNQLIKGSLLFGAGLFILFLVFVGIEYFGYLSTNVRFVLFYSFIAYNLFVLTRYVIMPFMGMIRIGKTISPEEASKILGKHFPEELNDKVTNVLQLKKFLNENPENVQLIMAGIDQKANQANVLPFQKAIPLKGNLRFLPYSLVPLVIIASFFFIQPAVIMEPAQRIVQYEVFFERPTPFVFHIESGDTGFKNEDLEIVVSARGDIFPSETFLMLNGNRYRMSSVNNGLFKHTIRNLQNDLQFFLEAQGYRFGPFYISVFEKASFHHFHIRIVSPEYTNIPDETYTNMGDLLAIRGAEITWDFFTNQQSEMVFYKDGDEIPAEKIREGQFRVETYADASFKYQVFAYDTQHGKGDSLSYFVNVQQDAYPRIAVEEHRDQNLLAHLFYRGTISDDFGFTGLQFYYRIMDQAQINRGEQVEFFSERLDIDPYLRNQTFYHYFDLNSVYVKPGETVEVYFQVYDNDRINGPKSARSQLFTYYIPTEEEILADRRKTEEEIKEGLSDGAGEVRDARDQIDELRKRLLETDRVGWEEREALQELLEKRKQMEQKMDELSRQKKDSETRSEQFRETNERIKQKQEELQKLFDEVLSDEMRDLFDQIQQELENMNRDDIYEMLDRMDFEFRDMELQLDRALEMFRQFAMERLLQESIDRLEQLAEEQSELSEEVQEGGADQNPEESTQKQEDIGDAFENIKDMLEEFRETNEMLSRPKDIQDTKGQEDSIMEDIQNALEQMMMQDMQNAAPFMDDAGQKMRGLSQDLQQMQQQIFQDALAEDARAIRQILENLLRSSFAQEDLMTLTRQANVNDPRYTELIREQRKIQSDMKMIEDSLIALSKRQIAIQSYVNREIAEINMHLDQGIHMLINRRRHQGASRQQLVMTHINNLALLLNESLQDVQQQMAMGMGMGDDDQQGPGGQSFQNLRQMQEQMNQMLEQMRQGFEPMPGEAGESPMSLSEQMARMAAEQEAIRNRLREMADEMGGDGTGTNRELEQIQRDMERTELDLLRKELSQQTMMRQERILTRLLEHERAEMEREQEARREGTTAEDYEISNPEDIFEYNRIREREVEMLRSMPPGLRPFYRTLVEQYFLRVE